MKKLNLKKNETPGHLITFCGLDGCGKSTMIRRLQADLAGKHPLFLTKQPTDAVRRSPIFRTYIDTPHHDAFDYIILLICFSPHPIWGAEFLLYIDSLWHLRYNE